MWDCACLRFRTIELKRLRWRDVVDRDSAVAGALLAKMGCSPQERVAVKREFLRMMIRMELDPVRIHLVAAFFDTYLRLTREEEAELMSEIKKLTCKSLLTIAS